MGCSGGHDACKWRHWLARRSYDPSRHSNDSWITWGENRIQWRRVAISFFFRPPGLKVPTKVKVGLPFCSAERLFSLSFFNRFCPFRFFFYIANIKYSHHVVRRRHYQRLFSIPYIQLWGLAQNTKSPDSICHCSVESMPYKTRQSGHYTHIRYTEVGRRAVHFYGYHASQFSRRIRNFKPEINHGVWVLPSQPHEKVACVNIHRCKFVFTVRSY